MRKMKRHFKWSYLIVFAAMLTYACTDNEPQEPELPGGETEQPVEPENPDPAPPGPDPDEPFNPVDIFFENFANKEIPGTFKLYDVDDAVIQFTPNWKYAWLAKSGDGVYSYGLLENSAQVDDWIVTSAIKITKPNSVLSWRMASLPTFVPSQPIKTTPEEYEVYISIVGHALTDFEGKTPQYATKVLPAGGFESKEINLDEYIGKDIYVAFRHCSKSDADVLWLQNIRVREYPTVDLACGTISFSGQPSHTFKENQNLTVQAYILNRSLAEVTTYKVRYKYGIQEVEQAFDLPIGRESGRTVTFTTPLVMSNPGESQDISVEVICEGDQNEPNNTNRTSLVCIGTEPAKRVLFQKITSVNCGPCGATHEVIENAENANPEKVVGITVHVNDVVYADNLDCKSYSDAYVAWTKIGFIQQIGGLPDWSTNQRFRGTRNIDEAFAKTTAPATIDVDVVYNAEDKSIAATVKTVFVANAVAKGYYALGLAVLEDGVIGWQMNSRSNIHNNTARELIGGYRGEPGSLPDNVVRGEENSYTFRHQIPAKYGIDSRTPVPANMEVVALLYDAMTGEVLNCVKDKIIK